MNIISQKDDLVADVKIYELKKTKLVSLFKEKTFMCKSGEKQLDNNEDIKLNDFKVNVEFLTSNIPLLCYFTTPFLSLNSKPSVTFLLTYQVSASFSIYIFTYLFILFAKPSLSYGTWAPVAPWQS